MEIRESEGFPSVLRCGVYATERNYAGPALHDAPYNYELAKAFVQDASRMFHDRKLFASNMTIILPADAAVAAVIPCDSRLDEMTRRDQLEWECCMLAGMEAGSKFRVFSQLLRRASETDDYLVAGLPRETIAFLTSTFSHLTFSVRSIEIDHFLFETMLPATPANIQMDSRAVIGMHEHRCTASILTGEQHAGVCHAAPGPRRTIISTALRALHSLLESSGIKVEEVFLYGSCADDKARAELCRMLSIPVRIFSPIRAVSFLAGSEAAEAAKVPASAFSAALLGALKGTGCE